MAFRSQGEAAFDNTGGPITPGMPTGWQVNDILVLVYTTTNQADPPLSEPSGWTLIKRGIQTGVPDLQTRLYWRRAQSGDTAPTLDDDGVFSVVAYILAYSGRMRTATPVDAANDFNLATGSSTTIAAAGLALPSQDDDVLVIGATVATCTVTGVDGSPAATERADHNNEDVPTGPSSGAYDFVQGQTTTSTRIMTFSQTGGPRMAVQIALRPQTFIKELNAVAGATATLLLASTFARVLSAIATGVASVGRAASFFRSISATAVGSATIARARVLARAISAVADAVASIATLMIPAGAIEHVKRVVARFPRLAARADFPELRRTLRTGGRH